MLHSSCVLLHSLILTLVFRVKCVRPSVFFSSVNKELLWGGMSLMCFISSANTLFFCNAQVSSCLSTPCLKNSWHWSIAPDAFALPRGVWPYWYRVSFIHFLLDDVSWGADDGVEPSFGSSSAQQLWFLFGFLHLACMKGASHPFPFSLPVRIFLPPTWAWKNRAHDFPVPIPWRQSEGKCDFLFQNFWSQYGLRKKAFSNYAEHWFRKSFRVPSQVYWASPTWFFSCQGGPWV